jgi:hypothetical protein
MTMIANDTEPNTLQYLADQAGVTDVFVLRRIGGNRFAHIGGVRAGRGLSRSSSTSPRSLARR